MPSARTVDSRPSREIGCHLRQHSLDAARPVRVDRRVRVAVDGDLHGFGKRAGMEAFRRGDAARLEARAEGLDAVPLKLREERHEQRAVVRSYHAIELDQKLFRGGGRLRRAGPGLQLGPALLEQCDGGELTMEPPGWVARGRMQL